MSFEDFSGKGGDGYIAGEKLDNTFWLPVQQIVLDPVQADDIRSMLIEEANRHPEVAPLLKDWDDIANMLKVGSLPDGRQSVAFFKIAHLVGLTLGDVIIRKRKIDS